MFNNKLKNILGCLVLIGLLIGAVDSASARSTVAGLSQPASILAQNGDSVAFSQLVTSDILLNGPFDANNVYFSLPANWRLTTGAQLNLSMAISFNQNAPSGSTNFQGSAGSITITLNGVLIGVVQIEAAGESTYQFPLSPEAFAAVGPDGRNTLRFFLESGWTCGFNENMLVSIHTSSSMLLPHESTMPDTSLANFPSPIYHSDSIFRTSVLVVIPDSPTAAELRSAMIVGGGFGNISSSKLLMDLSTVSQLTPEQLKSNNLILIGKASNLPKSEEISLPFPIRDGAFSSSDGKPEDGIIQLVNSPWNEENVVLVVSGNNDEAVIKSAQAVTTGSLRPNIFSNLAVVDAVSATPVPASPRLDQTLTEMGYAGTKFNSIGVHSTGYKFYIPPGNTITKDAYFELQFGHSALLQYDRAGIVVSVNGKPIGSISLTEETARQAVNTVRFSIPPVAVLTGYNSLDVKVSLIPVDKCANPNLDGVYANIWPDSNLHLPLVNSVTSPSINYDLISYPAPFAYDSTLNSTAFVLPRDDIASWRDAFQVANYLGDRSNGAVTTLSAFYADEVPDTERSKYNFIMVGRPSQLPIVSEFNELLPAPFDFGQDLANEPEMQVKYRVNPKAAVGYVEMLTSPWNGDNIILLAVGNEAQGVNWAASHLVSPLNRDLAGNFAVINDLQVYTANTHTTTITPGISAPQSTVLEVVPPAIEIGVSTPYRPGWLLPTLVVAVLLILLTIFAVISITWSHNRAVKKQVISDSEKEE